MKIDKREASDIENRIEELSKSYTPEWNFDKEGNEPGSVIAKLFAVQMKENIDLFNNMPKRYHSEFINMLDISLKPMKASQSLVNFSIIENTVPGTTVRKGTTLTSEAVDDEGNPVLFETDREVYVTVSRITDSFMTDREDGSIVPLLGDFTPVSILEGYRDVIPEEEEGETGEEEEITEEVQNQYVRTTIRPFVLFSETGNISRSILILYHETVFDISGEPIYIRISGNEELNKRIEKGEFVFKYYDGKDFTPFDRVELTFDNETFKLIKDKDLRKVTDGNREYGVVILESLETLTESLEIKKITLSSEGSPRSPEYLSDGTRDLDISGAAPFSETLSLYNEFYIGEDLYFSKKGAKITIDFHMEFRERGHYLTKQEEEESLKIVKKKPKVNLADIPAHSYADEVILEYYNGTGWKKLKCDPDITGLFTRDKAEDVTITFTCPQDMEPAETGANMGRAVRMRLLRADNCYLRPCIHHYPYLSGIKIAFTYGDRIMEANRVLRISGTEKSDITAYSRAGSLFTVFSGGNYNEDALYLGFDRRIMGGPVSLYFELEDITNQNALNCIYEYSTIRGFKRMRVVDHTGDFSHSGTVMFYPPSDMKEAVLEGRSRFWIKIRRKDLQKESERRMFLPHISRIMLNVVPVSNIETGDEENFYLNEVGPNLHFPLKGRNILDAEVWVNEKGYISREEADKMIATHPDLVRAEYDLLGGFSAFYVRWKETDSFLNVTDRRVFMIDRSSNEIIFSDGVKADIPRVMDDIAFKVKLRKSSGIYGNVREGAINETGGTELYIDSVYNPVRSYGGSDMETVPEALKRGANLLYGRHRLVTVNDYLFEMQHFSDSIDKVSCVPGEKIEGDGTDADISFVLLMKDFKDGAFSFHKVASELKEELLKTSSLTVSPDRIHIVEPLFVDVSVSVWAETENIEDSFEITSRIEEILNEYLDPVSNDNHPGWDIGVVPKKTQILMKLGSLKSHALIRKTAMVAHYADKDGEHETDISDLKVTPFMAVRPGKHTVHIVHRQGD